MEERHRFGYYVTPFALEGMNILLGRFLMLRAQEVEAE